MVATMTHYNYLGSGKSKAQYHADLAVYHANRAVKFNRIAFWLMTLSVLLQGVAIILRMTNG
jgi:hypothetical protein